MSSTKDLVEQARFLRNASPQVFNKFVQEFGKYTASMVDELITTTEKLEVAQGRAQLCVKLLRAFEGVSKNG